MKWLIRKVVRKAIDAAEKPDHRRAIQDVFYGRNPRTKDLDALAEQRLGPKDWREAINEASRQKEYIEWLEGYLSEVDPDDENLPRWEEELDEERKKLSELQKIVETIKAKEGF